MGQLTYDQYYEYKTVQGDTWDAVALDFYNDEYKASLLMQANPDVIDTLIFDAGIKLIVPVVEQETSDTLPPWKRR